MPDSLRLPLDSSLRDPLNRAHLKSGWTEVFPAIFWLECLGFPFVFRLAFAWFLRGFPWLVGLGLRLWLSLFWLEGLGFPLFVFQWFSFVFEGPCSHFLAGGRLKIVGREALPSRAATLR